MSEKANVIIVDDEPGPRASLLFILEDDYELLCFSSVEPALVYLKNNVVDAVLMDIGMPGMSGLEGLQRIRGIDPQLAVVMLTGDNRIVSAQAAIRLQAIEYILKPFSTEQIRDVTRNAVETTRALRRRASAEVELREINEQLLEELAGRDHTAKTIVHDILNPMSVIITAASQIGKLANERVGEGDNIRGWAQVLEETSGFCRQLIEIWRQYLHGDEAIAERFDLNTVVRTSVNLNLQRALDRGLRTEINLDSSELMLFGKSVTLLRVVNNLISNSIEAFGSNGGAIEVSTFQESHYAGIVVEDTAGGIPDHLKYKIFEKGFSTKGARPNAGLGLQICRSLIETEWNGTVTLEEGKAGARFVVRVAKSADFV